jgi:hypothetical protein
MTGSVMPYRTNAAVGFFSLTPKHTPEPTLVFQSLLADVVFALTHGHDGGDLHGLEALTVPAAYACGRLYLKPLTVVYLLVYTLAC